jgi:hypothetical protein
MIICVIRSAPILTHKPLNYLVRHPNMIKKTILITMTAILAWSSLALCDLSIDFLSRWPYAPTEAIAVDNLETPQWVFLGDGNFINILDMDLKKQASKEITTSGQVTAVCYSSNTLYVACGIEGLKIIDVSDPLNMSDPVVYGINTDETFIEARDVFVSNGYAYLLEDSVVDAPKIEVLDVSDPFDPNGMGEFTFEDYVPLGFWSDTREIYVAGGYAYVTDLINGLHIIDASNPGNIEYVTKFIFDNAYVYGIDISSSIAYLAGGGGGLLAVDISDPNVENSDRLYSRYPDPLPEASLIETVSIDVFGNYAYMADRSEGLRVFDISEPEKNLLLKGVYADLSGAYSVRVAGDYAFVTDDATGLKEIDVTTDPTSPALSASYDTPADAWDVYVTEDEDTAYAYVVDTGVGTESGEEGLRIIEAQGVFVNDDYAYVADGAAGLQIIDVYDPTKPEIVGSLPTAGDAKDVYVSGNYAYVAEGDQGIQVVDVRDKNHPFIDATVDIATDAQGVFVSGHYAYVADGTSGLRIFDVSATPIANLAVIDTDNALAVYVSDNHAYVADSEGGLKIIDVLNPAAPGDAVTLDTTRAQGIFVKEDLAFVADGAGGLRVVDVSDPADPQELRTWDSTGDAKAVFVSGDFAYLADGPGGMIILEHSYDPDKTYEFPEPTDLGGGGCFITTAFYNLAD